MYIYKCMHGIANKKIIIIKNKDNVIVTNRDLVYNQVYRLSHDTHVISHSYTCITFDYLFELVRGKKLSNFDFIN